jgi:nitrous oxidase accessory protein NosD
VVQGQQLNIAVSLAGPGDTISIRPGFYQEIVLVEKPLKFVGENGQDIQGRSRRGVVIQSNRSMCILSNARRVALNQHKSVVVMMGMLTALYALECQSY